MTTALIVVAIALCVLAAVQLALLAALWRVFGRAEQTLREVAAAADEFGRAVHQIGDLAGTTRNATEGLLSLFAFQRFAPRLSGGVGALRTGLELGLTLLKSLREHRAKSESA